MPGTTDKLYGGCIAGRCGKSGGSIEKDGRNKGTDRMKRVEIRKELYARGLDMMNYNLDTFSAADKLIRMCDGYKDKMEIDVIWSRYIVDAYSILGVYSMIGHVVSIEPITKDIGLLKEFEENLERIKQDFAV